MAMTLEQVFGAGAVQDGSSVIIQKAAIGLSSGSNTAESILAAILKTAAASVRGNIATDSYYLVTENGEALSFDNSDFYNYYPELWDTVLFPQNLIRCTVLVNDFEPYSS